jgi:single stranded DNA-binding protein
MNNQITIVGHVGQAPTSVSFKDSDNKVVKFSVAVKEYSSKTEEDKTMWIDVDAWNGLGQRVLDTITQGREVVVTGRLAISEYTKEINGVKVKMSKPLIKLTSFHLCGSAPRKREEVTNDSQLTEAS